jgi:hypothetical protein
MEMEYRCYRLYKLSLPVMTKGMGHGYVECRVHEERSDRRLALGNHQSGVSIFNLCLAEEASNMYGQTATPITEVICMRCPQS